MQKQALKNKLIENHQLFIEYIHSLSNEQFVESNNGKWTPGQQLEHILLSIKPVRQILTVPKFVLSLIWGKANRESKTYEELIAKYYHKLQQGGRATARFVPRQVSLDQKTRITQSIGNEIKWLNKKLDKFTEEELDRHILPHPLLGKLTIREMMYFTIYHVLHHKKMIERDLM
jgi:uncharacterized damage-inducible protein DinB